MQTMQGKRWHTVKWESYTNYTQWCSCDMPDRSPPAAIGSGEFGTPPMCSATSSVPFRCLFGASFGVRCVPRPLRCLFGAFSVRRLESDVLRRFVA